MRAFDIPLLPDPSEAHDWLEHELSDPSYDIATPTWFDRAARAVTDWFGSLFSPQSGNPLGVGLIILVGVVVVIALVFAILIWGRPRFSQSSRAGEALFGSDDERSAQDYRDGAARAAASGDWVDAIVLRFRGLARGLAERGAVTAGPGATVHAFAVQATEAFPDTAAELGAVADLFDAVRYLRQPGTAEGYARVVALDDLLARTRPQRLADLVDAS